MGFDRNPMGDLVNREKIASFSKGKLLSFRSLKWEKTKRPDKERHESGAKCAENFGREGAGRQQRRPLGPECVSKKRVLDLGDRKKPSDAVPGVFSMDQVKKQSSRDKRGRSCRVVRTYQEMQKGHRRGGISRKSLICYQKNLLLPNVDTHSHQHGNGETGIGM